MLGGVRLGFGEIYKRGFFDLYQGLTTFIAKLGTRCIGISTLRAGKFQFIPAFFTKLGVFTILKLAFWALHGLGPPTK
jgi:hypothetical protein